MTLPEWSLIIGVATSLLLAVGPWMVMVHAKLAVIASKVADLCDKMDQFSGDERELWQAVSKHASRLDTHDVQLRHIAERLSS